MKTHVMLNEMKSVRCICLVACVQMSPISFHPQKRDVCETASLIRVPVSCCSGFKFRINYDNTVLFSVPESFPADRSMIGGRTGLRGGI